jgi:hypothetical protein
MAMGWAEDPKKPLRVCEGIRIHGISQQDSKRRWESMQIPQGYRPQGDIG